MPKHRDRRATPLCAKIRPPRRGRLGKAAGRRQDRLRVAPLRDCATFLASGLPKAITAIAWNGCTSSPDPIWRSHPRNPQKPARKRIFPRANGDVWLVILLRAC